MTSQTRLRHLLIVNSIALAGLGHATTYYVATNGNDSNAGTISSPFATLSKATYVTKAGDTVLLRGGTYKWTARQMIYSKGTPSAPLTVASYPYEGAIIDGANTPLNTDIVAVSGSNLNVRYIQFNNGKKSNLALWNNSNIRVYNCGFGTAIGTGLFIGASTLFGATGFTVDHCKFLNNCTRNVSQTNGNWQPALQIYQVKDVSITNNTVKENWGEGVNVCSSSGVTVANNDVSDNFSVNVYLDNATFTTVKNNRIFNLGDTRFFRDGRTASGVSMACEGVANPIGVSDCTITNNVITNCYSGIWYSNYGLAGGIQRVAIRNNTVWGKENAVLRIDYDAGHLNNTIQNNVFYQASGRFISMGNVSNGFAMGDNCWYGGDPGGFTGPADLFTDPLLSSPGSTSAAGYIFLPLSVCPSVPTGADATLVGVK